MHRSLFSLEKADVLSAIGCSIASRRRRLWVGFLKQFSDGTGFFTNAGLVERCTGAGDIGTVSGES